MTEFNFAFDDGGTSLYVAPGETVRFIVADSGSVEHEFRLTTAAEADEHVGLGHAGHDDGMDMDMGGQHEEVILVVTPGYTDATTVTFSDDQAYRLRSARFPDT